jgi:hypothetical protein
MKIIKIALLLSVVVGSNFAKADIKNFEGPSVNLGLSTVNSSMNFNNRAGTVEGFGKNSVSVDISADYGIPMGPASVVLVGGSYGLSDPTAFSAASSDVGTGKITLTNRLSVFAAPGILLGEKVLAYGKLAYASGKPEATANLATLAGKTHDGFGYGLGIRVLLDSNLYANFEAMSFSYGSQVYGTTTVDAQTLSAGVALGYKF